MLTAFLQDPIHRYPSRPPSAQEAAPQSQYQLPRSLPVYSSGSIPSLEIPTEPDLASHAFNHHDFPTINEDTLAEEDVIIGEGGEGSLHRELIEPVNIPKSAARAEQAPAVHLQVVRKLGTGSYAVVYLVKEFSRGRSLSGHHEWASLKSSRISIPMPPSIDIQYGRDFAVKCLPRASLSPEELEIQIFDVSCDVHGLRVCRMVAHTLFGLFSPASLGQAAPIATYAPLYRHPLQHATNALVPASRTRVRARRRLVLLPRAV